MKYLIEDARADVNIQAEKVLCSYHLKLTLCEVASQLYPA
jgi:hypothetical protein